MIGTGEQWAIGIDLGGTNIRAAAIDADGRVLDMLTEPVEQTPARPREKFGQLTRLAQVLNDRCAGTPVGIGVGATGPVHRAEGVIDNPYTLPPAYQGNVREALRRRFDLPIVLENDSNAAAVGEHWLGAGRGARSLVCLTVGTGVGVGVIRDGIIHRGANGTHPEAGHHVVVEAGPACYCGRHGCVESLASGTALVTLARAGGASLQSAAEVFAQASAGDPVCRTIVKTAREAIVSAITNLVAVHAADVVVLSGGALGDRSLLLDQAQASLDAFAFVPPGGSTVRVAELPDLAGCCGAAYLTLQSSLAGDAG